MRFKAVLFDLDGTITDSAPGILHSMQLALADFAISAEPDELRKYLGPPLSAMFGDYLPPEQVENGVKAYRRYYHAGELFHAQVYPGVRETIISLYEDGCKVCLATAKPRETARRVLEHFGLVDYFTIVGGTEEENGVCTKTKVIQKLMGQLSLPPEQILMFGDRKDDLAAAAACKISAVGAGYGYAPPGELDAQPQIAIIAQAKELLPLVEGNFELHAADRPAAARQKSNPQKRLFEAKKTRIAAVAAIFTVVVCLMAALFGGCLGKKTSQTGNAGDYDTTVKAYQDIILPLTEDAGEEYLDDTLFAGDSNTVRLCNFGEVSLQNTLAYVGIGIQGVTDEECIWFEEYDAPVTMAQAVGMMQPRRIIMMFGTNNTSMDVDRFIAQYSQAYDEMAKAYPYADIIIAAVPPVAAGRENAAATMKKINSFNLALIKLAKEKDARFLNGAETLSGEDGYLKQEYAESDGLHLTQKAAEAYVKYVRTHSYITPDDRPEIKNVPTRMRAPYMPSESEADAPQPEASAEPTLTATPQPTLLPEHSAAPVQTPAPEQTPVPEKTPVPEQTPAPDDVPAGGETQTPAPAATPDGAAGANM